MNVWSRLTIYNNKKKEENVSYDLVSKIAFKAVVRPRPNYVFGVLYYIFVAIQQILGQGM